MSLHVQDAGDGVTLSEGGQRAHQLASMIQVAAVRAVQPHVGGGVVVVVSNRPARHTDARALITPVLFGDVKLKRRSQMSSAGEDVQRQSMVRTDPHLPNKAARRDGGGCEAVTFAS